jgi:hypothetical protein
VVVHPPKYSSPKHHLTYTAGQNENFDDGTRSMGYKRLIELPCVYQRGDYEFLLIYVVDTLLTSATKEVVKSIKEQMGSLFLDKELGEPS